MEMGDTDTTPYDLGTFGSRSTPDAGPGAAAAPAAAMRARALRWPAAASAWGIAAEAVQATGGEVRERDGDRRIPYAELVAAGPRTILSIPVAGSLPPRPALPT